MDDLYDTKGRVEKKRNRKKKMDTRGKKGHATMLCSHGHRTDGTHGYYDCDFAWKGKSLGKSKCYHQPGKTKRAHGHFTFARHDFKVEGSAKKHDACG